MSIHDHRPRTCPRDHQLTAGHVLVGWEPCQCPPAMVGGFRGHRTYRCRDCEADGVRMVCYLPYHDKASVT